MKTNYLFVGLGNPGPEYEHSRHSVGRMVLLDLVKKNGEEMEISDWKFNKKIKCQLAAGQIAKNKFLLVLPENFMNNSGPTIKPLIKTKAEATKLIVLHDDIDLPLSKIKISYGRGAGGHRGVESIIKALKTNEFTRVRLGVAPTTPSGKLKKPTSAKVVDFIVGDFKSAEQLILKKIIKQAKEIVVSLATYGREQTMNRYN